MRDWSLVAFGTSKIKGSLKMSHSAGLKTARLPHTTLSEVKVLENNFKSVQSKESKIEAMGAIAKAVKKTLSNERAQELLETKKSQRQIDADLTLGSLSNDLKTEIDLT